MHVVGMPANGGHWRAFRRLAAGTQVKKACPRSRPVPGAGFCRAFLGRIPRIPRARLPGQHAYQTTQKSKEWTSKLKETSAYQLELGVLAFLSSPAMYMGEESDISDGGTHYLNIWKPKLHHKQLSNLYSTFIEMCGDFFRLIFSLLHAPRCLRRSQLTQQRLEQASKPLQTASPRPTSGFASEVQLTKIQGNPYPLLSFGWQMVCTQSTPFPPGWSKRGQASFV